MKKGYRLILTTIFFIFFFFLLFVANIGSRKAYNELTCTKLKVTIKDSNRISFVKPNDVQTIIKENYGTYFGKRLDSINLEKIENILEGKKSILKSDAYLTNDGCLHIQIKQREPIVQINTSKGIYFADETGYFFPKTRNYNKEIPIIYGNIPINLDNNGLPKNKKDLYWINNLINMLNFMQTDKNWCRGIAKISIDDKGNLSLKPRIGKEVFFFGWPDHFKEKFEKIKDYYEYIVPAKGKDHYSIINVKFDGQIVCK